MSYFSAVHHKDASAGVTLLPSQRAKLRELFEKYRVQAEDEAALINLVRTIDPSLIHRSNIHERLAKIGYKYRTSPILTFEQTELLALSTPAFLEPELPKDEKETIDAFVQLGGQPDRGGFISSDTMRETLNNYKLLLDVQAVMNEVDTDGSGTIEYEEFEAFYRQKRSSIVGSAISISELSLTSAAAQQILSELLMNGEAENDDEWHDYAGSFASYGSVSDNEYVLDDGEADRSQGSPLPPVNNNSTLHESTNDHNVSVDSANPIVMGSAASPSPPIPADRLEASMGNSRLDTGVPSSPYSQIGRSNVSWSPQHGSRGASPPPTKGRPRSTTQAKMLSRQLQQVLNVHSSRLLDVNTKYSKAEADNTDIATLAAESCARTAAENRRKLMDADARPPSDVPSCFNKHTRNSIQRQPLNIQLNHPVPSRPVSAQERPASSRPTPASSRPTSARADHVPFVPRRRQSSGNEANLASGIQHANDENKGLRRKERTLEQIIHDAERKVEALREEMGTSRPQSAASKKATARPSSLDPRYDDTDGFIQEDDDSEHEAANPRPAQRNPQRPTSARVGGVIGRSAAGRSTMLGRPLTAPGPRGASNLPQRHAPQISRPFTATKHRPRKLQVEPAAESALFRGRDFYSYFASTAPRSAQTPKRY